MCLPSECMNLNHATSSKLRKQLFSICTSVSRYVSFHLKYIIRAYLIINKYFNALRKRKETVSYLYYSNQPILLWEQLQDFQGILGVEEAPLLAACIPLPHLNTSWGNKGHRGNSLEGTQRRQHDGLVQNVTDFSGIIMFE